MPRSQRSPLWTLQRGSHKKQESKIEKLTRLSIESGQSYGHRTGFARSNAFRELLEKELAWSKRATHSWSFSVWEDQYSMNVWYPSLGVVSCHEVHELWAWSGTLAMKFAQWTLKHVRSLRCQFSSLSAVISLKSASLSQLNLVL